MNIAIAEMNSNHDVIEGPLIVHFNPDKLTDLATVSLAAALMHHEIIKFRRNRDESCELPTVDLDEILLPQKIKSELYELVEYDMVDARTQWWAYHHECVFLQNFPADTMIDWLDQLVWLPGGAINYRQTAKKLLNCEKLTNVQKMQLACSYCFVEDVEVLKETLTNAEINNACGGYHNSKDLISRYWYNKLQLGPFFIMYVNSQTMLLNRVISSLKYYDEWSAVEYFFNQLNHEVRLLQVNDFIDCDKPNITWHLLLSLTGPELDSAIRGKSRQIMKTLVKERRFVEYTLLMWKRMIHLIDNNALAAIINDVNDLNYERSYLNPLLWEMWICTLERQKKFIVDERICDFIEKFDSFDYKFFNQPNYPLIIDLLSRSSPERRYEYLATNFPYLVIGQLHLRNRNFIDQLMKLCIGNDQQIETFKNTIMTNYDLISEECEFLMHITSIKAVWDYVDFCTSNQHVNRDLKKKIITKMPEKKWFYLLFNRYWFAEEKVRFNRYMNEIFTEHELKEFFNGIVTHPDNLKKMRRKLTDSFQEVIGFVEKYVSSEKNLFKVKHDFFLNYRLEENYSDEVFFDLTVWCFNGDERAAKKFKKLSPRVCEVSDVEMKPVPESKKTVFEAFMKSFRREDD